MDQEQDLLESEDTIDTHFVESTTPNYKFTFEDALNVPFGILEGAMSAIPSR